MTLEYYLWFQPYMRAVDGAAQLGRLDDLGVSDRNRSILNHCI